MVFFYDIFQITFKSEYYKSKYSNDFDIIPTQQTSTLLQKYSLFLKKNTSFKISMFSKDEKIDLDILKEIVLEFNITVKNKNIYNFSDIKINKFYTYKNTIKDQELQIDDDIKLTNNEISQDKLFGKIFIYGNKLNRKDNNYYINIPTIKSFWEINFTDDTPKNLKYKFLLNDEIIEFKKNKDTNTYLSTEPIELKGPGYYKFLIEFNKDNKMYNKKILPPTIFNKILDSKFISTIYLDKNTFNIL